jgi:hypothetical protein
MLSIQNTIIITVVTISVAKLLKESISLLFSGYKFINMLMIISLFAHYDSGISNKLNRFVDNLKLLLKFMFEYDNAAVNLNSEVSGKFEDLLSKIRDLFKKIQEPPIMNKGWCDLDKKNIMRTRRPRAEINYREEEDEELEDEELEDEELEDEELEDEELEDEELEDEELEDEYEHQDLCDNCSSPIKRCFAHVYGKSYCKDCFFNLDEILGKCEDEVQLQDKAEDKTEADDKAVDKTEDTADDKTEGKTEGKTEAEAENKAEVENKAEAENKAEVETEDNVSKTSDEDESYIKI